MIDRSAFLLKEHGFAFEEGVYSTAELEAMVAAVEAMDGTATGVMRTEETYAIRQVMKHVPALLPIVLNERMQELLVRHLGDDAFVCKSIWFDKPSGGNWFVGYHQDISINVVRKIEAEDYSRWTSKHGLIGVVPPVDVLERVLTVRIHVDRADASNGALKVKAGTHRFGLLRDPQDGAMEVECPMEAGDVMLMRPLLLHASMRSTVPAPRRVLHLEFSRDQLANGMAWAEQHAPAPAANVPH